MRIAAIGVTTILVLASGSFGPANADSTAPLLETLDGLNEKIRYYDQLVTHMAEEEYPETCLLRQVSGVGPVTALYFRLVIVLRSFPSASFVRSCRRW
jgi:hypothetical protein